MDDNSSGSMGRFPGDNQLSQYERWKLWLLLAILVLLIGTTLMVAWFFVHYALHITRATGGGEVASAATALLAH